MTGVLQTHTRIYKIAMDKLAFKFKVMHPDKDKEKLLTSPKDGVYISGL